MRLTLLPSSVSGSDAVFLTSYRIDDHLVIDAGSVGLWGTVADQAAIRWILLTHGHIDHIASLPIFVDNVYRLQSPCVQVYAESSVLDTLRRDIFNDRVMPDFIRLSQGREPFLELCELVPEVTFHIDHYSITPIRLHHTSPTLGFLIESDGVSIAILGDTGPTHRIWQKLAECDTLAGVLLEATFPNSLSELAHLSGHLTPKLFAAERAKLAKPVPFYAVHLKPRFAETIRQELLALNDPSLTILEPNRVYSF